MYLLILYFPFINFILISFFGRFIGTKGSNFLSIINMFLTFILSYFIFFEVVLKGSVCFFKLFSWINIGLLNVSWGFYFDPVTSTMLIVVNTISFFVHLYSIDYMKNDFFSSRFMSYLSLFTLFMLILISSDNYLQLFVGWEGVGLVSFLLINFWFTIKEANKSALKAMIMNRIGDIGIVLAISLIYFEFKTLDYNIIFALSHIFFNDFFFLNNTFVHIFTLITIFILIGAIGKSAQFGLHTWLPDAMAGPTPVSALIHAATMVTAGVFILIRSSIILDYSTTGLFLITIVGIFTAFFSATIGIFQNDIKKIIAYSTCSQLGYMVFICGLSNYSLSLFHLTNHAFFKALLFLSAGSIIHALSDEQDIRKYGGLLKILPFSYVMILIGSLSLMGVPFLTGFYSKDLIIEVSFISYLLNNGFVYWLSVITAFFTSIYSIRLILFTFFVKPNGFKKSYQMIHDSPFFMMFSLFFLCINSIFFGFIFKDLFVGLGVDTWLNSFNYYSKNILFLESEFLPFYIKNIPFFFSLLGIFIACFFHNYLIFFKKNLFIYIKIYNFFYYKWYIDVLYNKIFVKFFFLISYNYIKYIDRGFIELFGPLGCVRFINFFLMHLKFVQTGFLYNYFFLFIIITFFVIFFMLNFIIIEFDFFFLLLIFFFLNKNNFSK
jgi:NADH-ubiquinone oxidoreductase chain 5